MLEVKRLPSRLRGDYTRATAGRSGSRIRMKWDGPLIVRFVFKSDVEL